MGDASRLTYAAVKPDKRQKAAEGFIQAALQEWLTEYSWLRPHGSLKGQPPISVPG